jgi:glycosyltransferase involved in cell wall biosynthesis
VTENRYVLVTAAYNEEAFIETTIRSVVEQTHRPERWIIVSDGSTDRTVEIVQEFATRHAFIELVQITEDHARNFAAQVNAINAGVTKLQHLQYDFIGNLDADVSFDRDYFARLLLKFQDNSRLGLGGGFIYDKCSDGNFRRRTWNSVNSVAHAVQLFRRVCFEVTEAYLPLPYGGPDSHAETTARMKGWEVESFPDLVVFHHRPTGSAGGVLKGLLRQGKMDYSLGYLPLFEILKLAFRMSSKPYVVGAVTRLAGFVGSYWRGDKHAVTPEFMNFLRSEQKRKLRELLPMLASWDLKKICKTKTTAVR